MIKVLTSVNVAYPDEFYHALDGFNRRPFGELKFVDHAEIDCHNVIYLLFDWDSVENAEGFWNSTQGRAHVESWRCLKAPQFVYLGGMPKTRKTPTGSP
jgi:hypothetical protein